MQAESLSSEIVKQMGKEGFLGLWILEEYEGQSGDAMMLGITIEEFGKANHAALLLMITSFPVAVIAEHSHLDAQRDGASKNCRC